MSRGRTVVRAGGIRPGYSADRERHMRVTDTNRDDGSDGWQAEHPDEPYGYTTPPRVRRRVRRRLSLPGLLIAAVVLGVAAGVVGRGFVSPAQQAARAAPPALSLITSKVSYGALAVQIVLQAKVSHGYSYTVYAPSALADSPVVTSENVSPGERVDSGDLIGTVAEQPVFVMRGRVPAFRSIGPGVNGVDVTELQDGLKAAGYGVGSDAAGRYGPGTAAAVGKMYRAAHLQPDVPTSAQGNLRRATTALAAAQHRSDAARSTLATDLTASHSRLAVNAARLAVRAAVHAVSEATAALAQAQTVAEPEVPLGEVAFVPDLPGQVLSAAPLGSTVSEQVSGSSAGKSAGSGLAVIGAARVRITATASALDIRQLRRGMRATAISDTSGTQVPAKIASLSGESITLVPLARVPGGLVGQSVELTIVTRRVKSFVVPVAALDTNGSGLVYVTVVESSGRERVVWVRVGLSSGGRQAVVPTKGTLSTGDQVVIGRQAS